MSLILSRVSLNLFGADGLDHQVIEYFGYCLSFDTFFKIIDITVPRIIGLQTPHQCAILKNMVVPDAGQYEKLLPSSDCHIDRNQVRTVVPISPSLQIDIISS